MPNEKILSVASEIRNKVNLPPCRAGVISDSILEVMQRPESTHALIQELTSTERVWLVRAIIAHDDRTNSGTGFLKLLFESFHAPEEWSQVLAGSSRIPHDFEFEFYCLTIREQITPSWMADVFRDIVRRTNGAIIADLTHQMELTRKNLMAGCLVELFRDGTIDLGTIYQRTIRDDEIASLALHGILTISEDDALRREIMLNAWGKPGKHFRRLPTMIRFMTAVGPDFSREIIAECEQQALTLKSTRLLIDEICLLTFLSDAVCPDLERARQLVKPEEDRHGFPITDNLNLARLPRIEAWFDEWATSQPQALLHGLEVIQNRPTKKVN